MRPSLLEYLIHQMDRRTKWTLVLPLLMGPLFASQAGAAQATKQSTSERRAKEHFRVCDLDENGWVSLREATVTLGIDRSEFRSFDADSDGRLDESEFRERYDRMLELLGAGSAPLPSTENLLREAGPPGADATGPRNTDSLAPIPAPAAQPADFVPFPAPSDLISTYDRDQSGGMNLQEVAEALRRANALLSADVILEQTDGDQSGELEGIELSLLSSMLSRRLPWSPAELRASPRAGKPSGPEKGRPSANREGTPSTEAVPVVPPGQIDSTSGEREPAQPVAAPSIRVSETAPPQRSVPGRFGHFDRLDVDGGGSIEASDLETLLTPARSSVRASAIVSALDLDGDGALDSAEFRAALAGGN